MSESTSQALFSLAGFQVTIIGRFWVTAEVWGEVQQSKQTKMETRLVTELDLAVKKLCHRVKAGPKPEEQVVPKDPLY